jgi:hypothetical protein
LKRVVLVLFVMLVVVALLAPMAVAQDGPPRDQNLSGKYTCYGPWVIQPDGEEAQAYYSDLSKKEAEEGLASGAYVECSEKTLPYQASEPGSN